MSQSKITLREGRRADGDRYHNFETLDVMVDGTVVGMIQCVGPCRGLMAPRTHRHGPWIAFVGPDSNAARNLAGTHASKDKAVDAVVAAPVKEQN